MSAKGKRIFALALLVLASCHRGVQREECMGMLDRYVGMKVAEDPGLAHLEDAQAAATRDARIGDQRSTLAYARSLQRCEREVSRAEFDCAMNAKTPNDWEACIE
jgi:hypothetical protein